MQIPVQAKIGYSIIYLIICKHLAECASLVSVTHSLATGVPDQSKYVSYRGRSMAKVDYQEEVISDDDEYLCESLRTLM